VLRIRIRFFSDPGSYPGHGSLNANPVRTLASYGIHSRWYNFRLLVYPKFDKYLCNKKTFEKWSRNFLLANFIPHFVEFFTNFETYSKSYFVEIKMMKFCFKKFQVD
jgi:hypothetical protein